MIRLFHKELEAYLVAEGLFDEVVTEDGESPPFSFSHSPAPHHLGFKKQQPPGVKGRTFVSFRFSTEGTLYTHIKDSKERYLLGQITQPANFRGNPLYQATKRHLNKLNDNLKKK